MSEVLPRKLLKLLALALTVLLVAFAPAFAQDEDGGEDVEDVSVFYEELQNDGRWERHHEWGYVWIPDDVDDDWRPYTLGYWTYNDDYGWYWVSDEPWGWAVYHYGRWGYDGELGWFWVPGTKWAPAWVAWRWSDDFVGWAALPPDAAWDDDDGIEFRTRFYDSPRYIPLWVFVAPSYMTSPQLHSHIHNWRRNRDVFFRTRPVTRYGYRNRRVFNRGIERREIERLTRRRIESSRFIIGRERSRGERFGRSPDGVRVFRPRLKRPEQGIDPRTLGRREGAPPRVRREGRRGPNLLAPEGSPEAAPGSQPGSRGPKGEFAPKPGPQFGKESGGKDFDRKDGGKDGKGFDKGPDNGFDRGQPRDGSPKDKSAQPPPAVNQPQAKPPPRTGTEQPVFKQQEKQQPKQFKEQQVQPQPVKPGGAPQPKVLNRPAGGQQAGPEGGGASGPKSPGGGAGQKSSGPSGGRQDGDRRGKRDEKEGDNPPPR